MIAPRFEVLGSPLPEQTCCPLRIRHPHLYLQSISRPPKGGRIFLILLVGAGRFERPTPCAQGSFRRFPGNACFLMLSFL